MAKNSGVGLADLEAAFAEAEASLTDEATEPVSLVKSVETKASTSEQPSVVEPEVDEDVDLLSILEENLEDQEAEEQRRVDDDSPTHLVNGKNLTTQELINGFMRQEDYTKKTQEIADDRKRLANAETLYNAIQEEPYETLRLLWQKYNLGNQNTLTTTPASQNTLQAANIDELVAQKVSEILGSDPRIAQVQSLAATQAEDAQFTDIEREFGKTLTTKDREIVRKKAVEVGTDNLRFVFAGLLQEAQLRLARKEQLKKASSVSGRRSDENETQPTKKSFDSFEEAFLDSLRELGQDE